MLESRRMSYRIVFMGSPEFALPSLRALTSAYSVVGVVTQPDREAGRGRQPTPPPVKRLALELGLPLMQPERLRSPEAMSQLREWNPDLIVVVAYGQILKPEVLTLPPYGCLNVHASLLPRWRGAAPIPAAILAGDEQTGVTIMKMDEGLDTGPIVAQQAIPLQPDDTTASVSAALATLGANVLLQVLPDYLSGRITPVPQPAEGVTYAPMLKKEDGRLDFTRPAIELERRVRAMNPWPGAWFEWQGAPLRVWKASMVADHASGPAGTRILIQGRPAVVCGEGILVLEEVQPPGKRPMDSKSFLAGGRTWV